MENRFQIWLKRPSLERVGTRFCVSALRLCPLSDETDAVQRTRRSASLRWRGFRGGEDMTQIKKPTLEKGPGVGLSLPSPLVVEGPGVRGMFYGSSGVSLGSAPEANAVCVAYTERIVGRMIGSNVLTGDSMIGSSSPLSTGGSGRPFGPISGME